MPREQGETSEGAPDAKSSSGWDWPAPRYWAQFSNFFPRNVSDKTFQKSKRRRLDQRFPIGLTVGLDRDRIELRCMPLHFAKA